MKINSILKQLSLADLSELIGMETIDGLSELGVSTTKSSLIDLLLNAKGLSFFEKKSNRAIVFSKPAVISELGIRPEDAQVLIDRSWSVSASNLADLLDVDVSSLLSERKGRDGTVNLARPAGSLFLYQNWMRKNVATFFQNQSGRRTLVHMPTGAGKTRTAMNIVLDQIRPETPSVNGGAILGHSSGGILLSRAE